ncbi:hypothetical protein VHUM_04077 [Vanrija humicola]|uniref:Endonuclease/exonuclease/phosphatase domain-containing protein n=1 Tax=Vanrija humicola TaxID=5417 RepID=A0A7D8UYQ0_VANHU|nr:hypothetical protein VHUM_04077 [Vanrija humicola]
MPFDIKQYIAKASSTPGPDAPHSPGGQVTPQQWHAFDGGAWVPATSTSSAPDHTPRDRLTLVTWNIDGFGAHATARADALLARVEALSPAPEIILFQEVNAAGAAAILASSFIRAGYYSSEGPAPGAHWDWEGVPQPFVTLTLVSCALRVGELTRTSLPSRYDRDLLTADVQLGGATLRVVNVHLDSLAHDPSFRPAQVALAAESIKAAGAGVVAGDWNPVLPLDDALCADNGLTDEWAALKGAAPGFTWNWDGRSKEPFPPNRLDKVATYGVRAADIGILEPGTLSEGIDWSDHCGLRATLVPAGTSKL